MEILNLDLNIIVLIVLLTILTIFLTSNWVRNREKIQHLLAKEAEMQADFEKRSIVLEKEASVRAKERLQQEYKDLDEEIRERRQEINKIETRLAKREDQIEEQAQSLSDKEYALDKKMDEVLGKEDYLSPWTFTSDDGRFEMDFVPILNRSSLTDLKLLKSDQNQVFGRFTGTAVLDDGTILEVKDLLGFAEKVENKW